MMLINTSMNPLIIPPFDRGNTILKNLRRNPAFSTWAASSNSVLIWSILDVPALEAKGMFFTTAISTSRAKEPYRDGTRVIR